jgi:hypothetical protein
MQYQIKYFEDYGLSEWDSLVVRFEKATFDHSWTWLTFISKQANIVANVTFVCMENSKTPLAIVPLAVTKTAENNIELSFNGFPVSCPGVRKNQTPYKTETL